MSGTHQVGVIGYGVGGRVFHAPSLPLPPVWRGIEPGLAVVIDKPIATTVASARRLVSSPVWH